MRPRVRLEGVRFGRLVAIKPGVNRGRFTTWVLVCDCGTTIEKLTKDLRIGDVVSCGCKKREQMKSRGAAHPAWLGGKREDRDGYVLIYAPDHRWPRNGGYVREHVLVMELHIGRRVNKNECVHHVDHDRKNNNLSNLKLMLRTEHSSDHAQENSPKRKRDGLGRYA